MMSIQTEMKSPATPGNTIARLLSIALLLGLLLGLSACASFAITTPPEMVEVTSEYDKLFDYRATTIDGVALGVRVLDEPAGPEAESPGEDFWVEAIKRRMRLQKGYALLGEEKATSANGHTGTLLKFGRDQHDVTFIYWLTIYRTDENLHLVDAGGREDHFEKALPTLQKALSSYEVNP